MIVSTRKASDRAAEMVNSGKITATEPQETLKMVIALSPSRSNAAEFDHYAQLPENQALLLEFVAGEIIQKMPSNPFSAYIAGRFILFFGMYLLQNPIGYVTASEGGFMIGDDRYAPDMAFVRYARQAMPVKRGYNPIAPDLAVEVISDSDNAQEWRTLVLKISHYLAAGVVVLVVETTERQIEVHTPGQPPRILGIQDSFDGGDLLPGFTLQLTDIFPPELTVSNES
jgi:Uma2 family endonuclease